ncbi:amphiphysin isoform X2 [Nilaparvata lugens]|uniref:amphiphysin isoform X2 n=1 Tax=Nilaparvata lugens TaxID=108931 RepID=UPI00193E9BC6|nr:amphiphysin isoform X2 [Nilaparvata lugens]
MDSLNEIYESGWTGHDLVYVQAQNAEMLWQDFSHKLADQVLIPLNTYQAQFPEMRKKIEKRNRKLVDFDSQRHNMQSLEGSGAGGGGGRKRDEAKVARARDLLEDAKRTYECLNSELHDELPALYDSRVLFLVTNLQTLFAAEQLFHSETAKVYAELEAIVDKLATDSQRGSYTLKKTANHNINNTKAINSNSTNNIGSPTSTTAVSVSSEGESTSNGSAVVTPPTSPIKDSPPTANGHHPPATPTTATSPTTAPSRDSSHSAVVTSPTTAPSLDSSHSSPVYKAAEDSVTSSQPPVTNGSVSPPPVITSSSTAPVVDDVMVASSKELEVVKEEEGESKKAEEELYDIPTGATTEGLPAGVLYRVKATYKYVREDMDELSFDVGEIIRVVQYDDPEEQEEGWLMGVKESNGEKGMFPANFTRPL